MKENHGFTLLEVLLATTVLGVVMAMLTLSLSATFRTVETTEEQEEIFYQAQAALRLIREDIAAAVVLPDIPFTGKGGSDHAEANVEISFPSQSHLVFNPEKQRPGLAVICYQVVEEDGDKRQFKLLRSDTPVLPGVSSREGGTGDEGSEQALLVVKGLRAVQWKYFNGEGQKFDSWQEDWSIGAADNKRTLPAAVECTLEFWVDTDKELSQSFTTRILIPTEAEDERQSYHR
ncbi:MAG: prepilin-type N-terminal cleavage/methylation domain-containing protein [Desulfobulbus sp.]|nr:prepilin-type N-terminal cleavage/methylation domain-containing protein [Desulfobulbus sp.]